MTYYCPSCDSHELFEGWAEPFCGCSLTPMIRVEYSGQVDLRTRMHEVL